MEVRMYSQISAVGLFVIGVAFVGSGQADGGSKLARNPWHGFESGAWVVFQEKKTLDENTQTAKFKEVLVKYEGDVPRLARIAEVNGVFGDAGETFGRPQGGMPSESEIISRRQDTIKIGAQRLSCAVVEYEIVNKKSDFRASLIFWHNGKRALPYREVPASAGNPPALPGDVVRAEYAYHYLGASVKYTVEVVDFERTMKVGNRDITCLVEKLSFQETAKGKKVQGEGVRWLSADVPGHEVKLALKGTSNGVPLEIEKTVLDFQGRKRP